MSKNLDMQYFKFMVIGLGVEIFFGHSYSFNQKLRQIQ